MKELTQKEYVINECKAAINANIPIIYLVTDDVSLVDQLIKTEEIVPYWYLNPENEWTRHNDPACPLEPANIYVCDGDIKKDFGAWGEGYGLQTNKFGKSSFVTDASEFKYIRLNGVRGGIPQLIAVRNYHRSETRGNIGDEILQRLVTLRQNLSLTDGVQRCTILLQSPKFDLPEGLDPYVEVIEVPPLRDDEIARIIVDFAASIGETPYKSCLDLLTGSMRGLSSTKVKELLHRICLQCGGVFNVNTERLGVEIVGNAKKQMLKKEGLLKAIDLSDKEVAGLGNVKKWANDRKHVLSDPVLARKRWTIDAPKGMLINGIPGTGKSLLAMTLASVLNLPLYQFDMGQVLGKYMGESEENMRRVFRLAEALSPCVLWIDEIEKAFSSASASGDSDGGVGKRLFGSFLTWMQEKTYPCLIFATANDISSLPSEFLRRGRFDVKFYTFMPTKEECRQIFRSVIAGKGDRHIDKFDPEILSDQFLMEILDYCGAHRKFMTGADIEGIVADAKFYYYLSEDDSDAAADGVVFKAARFRECLIDAIDKVRTYGETDMHKIVKTLYLLAQNMFTPAADTSLVDLARVDCVGHVLPPYAGPVNGYDELLYQAIVNENAKQHGNNNPKTGRQ